MFAGVIANSHVQPFGALEQLAGKHDSAIFSSQKLAKVSFLQKGAGLIGHQNEGQISVVGWVWLTNRQALAKALNLGPASESGDLHLLAAAYSRWGAKLVDHIYGEFCFALWDEPQQQALLVRDHMGTRPLYYSKANGVLSFAASLADLSKVSGSCWSFDEEWLAMHLLELNDDWTKTAYEQVKKVPPGHMLIWNQGTLTHQGYFDLADIPVLPAMSSDGYVQQYRQLLVESVACRIPQNQSVGSELSGGIDSSTVTALLAQGLDKPNERLHALGFAHLQQEPQAIMDVSQAIPMAATHLITGSAYPNTIRQQRLQQFHRLVGLPVEHANALSHSPFYDLCQAMGIKTLFSGFGGDEFVTGHAPQVRVDLWRGKQYRAWLSRLAGHPIRHPLEALKWWHAYGFGQFATARNLSKTSELVIDQTLLTDEIMHKYRLAERLRHQYKYDSHCQGINHFQLSDRWSPLMTGRMESCSAIALAKGIDYRWPLMDVRLIQFFLAVPAIEKLGPRGVGRYLHRRAIAPYLPNSIVWRSKHMGTAVRPLTLPGMEGKAVNTASCMSQNEERDQLAEWLKTLVSAERYDQALAGQAVSVQSEKNNQQDSTRKRSINNRLLRKLNDLNGWLNQL